MKLQTALDKLSVVSVRGVRYVREDELLELLKGYDVQEKPEQEPKDAKSTKEDADAVPTRGSVRGDSTASR